MADEVPLESDTFWCIDPSVVRLRACHVMAWTAGLAALTLAAPLSYRASTAGIDPAGRQRRRPGDRSVGHGVEPGDGARRHGRRPVDAPAAGVAVDLVGAVDRFPGVGGLSDSWADVDYPPAPTHFPGLRGAIYVLLGVQVLLLIKLLVFTGWSLRGRTKSPDAAWRPTLRGFTAPFVALIAWLAGGGFSVGVGLWTAQVLGDVVVSTAAARTEIDRRADISMIRRRCSRTRSGS